jgi:hypothetical protein
MDVAKLFIDSAAKARRYAHEFANFYQSLAGALDRLRASFDRLRMRAIHCATNISPHPELVEGRNMVMQPRDVCMP